MKTNRHRPMRGLDNNSIVNTNACPVEPPARKTTRSEPKNHPLVVAVRAAEAALAKAREEEASAVERYEVNDVSHGDETWDNGVAAHTAIATREAAEEKLREAAYACAAKFGRAWRAS
jgi:hypothetical protein